MSKPDWYEYTGKITVISKSGEELTYSYQCDGWGDCAMLLLRHAADHMESDGGGFVLKVEFVG
jgi:hypothetical protein